VLSCGVGCSPSVFARTHSSRVSFVNRALLLHTLSRPKQLHAALEQSVVVRGVSR